MARKESASSSSEMRYTCDQPGCTKSYSRPDHLLRHKLNHDQARVLCCNQCDRTFVRQDLLIRHLERHALRGKTLGRWSNRNKHGTAEDGDDADGSSSPNKGSSGASANKRHRSGTTSKTRRWPASKSNNNDDSAGNDSEDDEGSQSPKLDNIDFREPGSDPRANIQSREPPPPQPQPSSIANPQQIPSPWSAFTSGPLDSSGSHVQSNQSAPYGASSTWSSNPPMSPPTSRPAHNYGATASSYRAAQTSSIDNARPPSAEMGPNNAAHSNTTPYPASSYRNDSIWADDPANGNLRPDHIIGDEPSATAQPHQSFGWIATPRDTMPNNQTAGSYTPQPSASYMSAWNEAMNEAPRPEMPMSMGDLDTTNVVPNPARPPSALPPPDHDIFPFAPPMMDHAAHYGWLFDGIDPFGGSNWGGSIGRPPTAGSNARGAQSQTSGFSPSSSDGLGGLLGNMHGSQNGAAASAGAGDVSSFGRAIGSEAALTSGSEVETPNALEDLAYFAALQADIPSRVTYHLDPVAHRRLLIFLQSVSELPNSPLFTPSALRCYIYLFFVKFNRLYPLVHEPTFAASTTDPMLLSAIVVIGAHFAGLPAHELAVRIAQKIWGAIVSLEDFRPARATLPMLQALVLTECFGKVMSTRPQHEMAHLFHNFIITLARRNAVFNATTPNPSHLDDSEGSWRSWAREEEKKRIALFAFMLDAQHATIFRHIPSLSAFQIQLHLPCGDEEWSMVTPEAWFRHRKRTGYKPPGPFIPALKACLSPAKTPQDLDAFPRFVLLHGLMSIAYDLQWKQNVLLGAETSPGGTKNADNGIGNWKDRLSAAYSSLQARMDIAYIKADEESSTRLIHRATPSLVAAAQIALFADIIDIQIYAGLPSVLGRFIDRATFNASRQSVKEWARTSDGRAAVWYAVNFLRTSLSGVGTESYGTVQPSRFGGSVAAGDESREATTFYPGLRDAEGRSGFLGGSAIRKVSDRETGLDEVLHHRWSQYLCALVIWAYGHALATPRVGPAATETGAGVGVAAGTASSAGPNSASLNGSAALNTSMSHSPGALQGQVSAERTQIGGDMGGREIASARPSSSSPLKPEGIDYLERMSTKTADDIAYVDCNCYTRGVLEMVEHEVRASRWELGREASGVLRKLISNHSLPVWDRSKFSAVTEPDRSEATALRNDLSTLTIQQQARPISNKDDPDTRGYSIPSSGPNPSPASRPSTLPEQGLMSSPSTSNAAAIQSSGR